MTAETGSWGIISGVCDMKRLKNTVSNTFTVPPSGTVTLRIASTSSNSGEYASSLCMVLFLQYTS